MKIGAGLSLLLSAVVVGTSDVNGFGIVSPARLTTFRAGAIGQSALSMSTAEEEKTAEKKAEVKAEKKEEKVEGKTAGKDAPPVNIGWDSHKPVDEVPDSLVREGDGPDGNYPMRSKFEKMCREAQIKITQAISDIDGEATFQEDAWTRANGGGGMSRVLSGGKVFEKAGVNLSVVYGSMPQEALQAATERGVDRAKGMAPGERVPFFACGLSSVMHPKNPFCPTMHFNYRYFETDGGVWWFGGGTDITPSYIDEDDMKHFHGTYKEICDKHDPNYYKEFKAWADRYFVIQHRNETRGLGGIFFDDQNDRDADTIFEFSKECLNSVVKAYGPIIEKHKDDEYTQKQKEWQLMRRGRYVEFNLVYDRGTVFGLKTGGRIESILMSLPETARWEYDFQVEEGSPEADFIDACKHSRDWV
uniref:coproporphyrinogen oxidase n=2 Tax=Ditylum brightwellii TaxID=49249 RepID=A0A6V2PQX8_9STRA